MPVCQASGVRPLRVAVGVRGKVTTPPAQLSMLLEGIDWRVPVRTWKPLVAE